jgi:RNA polymerase sigma-70 factor (sigma-E family)
MRAADDADFSNFVAASSRRLLRTAYLITDDLAEAEALLQIALAQAYRRWPSIRRKDVPAAHVRRMLVRAVIGAGRRPDFPAVAPTAAVPPAEGQLPDPRSDRLPSRAALLSCIRKLPVAQRAVLVLRYFDDLTEADTARALGCAIGAVRSEHATAIMRLCELVPGDADDASDTQLGEEHEHEARR